MMKRIVVAALLLAASGPVLAQATPVNGKVVAVDGDKVTVQVEAGKAAALPVGTEVEVKAKDTKEAPKKGADALMGC